MILQVVTRKDIFLEMFQLYQFLIMPVKSKSEHQNIALDTAWQTTLAEYEDILKRRDLEALLPFLKEKTKGKEAEFKVFVKNNFKNWLKPTEYPYSEAQENLEFQQWKQLDENAKLKMVLLTAIPFLNESEIIKVDGLFWLFQWGSDKYLLEILSWSKPVWVTSFLLSITKKFEWARINYKVLREMEDLQIIEHEPEIYALSLAAFSHYHRQALDPIEAKKLCVPFVNDTLAFQRDIPLLFQYPTKIHYPFYLKNAASKVKISLWQDIFLQLLAENKMKRSFFIENCLLVQTKDWDNKLKLFYRNCLTATQATSDELVLSQENIFACLHVGFVPIVNFGVDLIKKIYTHSSFDIASFLEWIASLLVRSDCKSAIKILLPIFEYLSKNYPKYSSQISSILLDVFSISDLGLQEQVTVLLQKIAKPDDLSFQQKLLQTLPLLQGNLKNTLQNLLSNQELPQETKFNFQDYQYNTKLPNVLTKKVVLPETWNDILFQFGKFIQSEEVLETEILLYAITTKQYLFPEDAVNQLQPYLVQMGHKFDKLGESYKKYLVAFLLQEIFKKDLPWKIEFNEFSWCHPINIFHALVEIGKQKKQNQSVLPLLSLPTHAPYWIEPKILLERIIAYYQAKEKIDVIDLSVAICRMPREKMEDALPLLRQLDPALEQIIAFCLGFSTKIATDFEVLIPKNVSFSSNKNSKNETIALWAIAARTHYPQDIFSEFEKTDIRDVPFVVSSTKFEIVSHAHYYDSDKKIGFRVSFISKLLFLRTNLFLKT
jgi:hypothetical protein